MTKKTVKLNNEGIQSLPQNKPVVYKILNKEGDNIYTGIAKKGNVQGRIEDHLPGHRDAVPGAAKVQIEQHSSIDDAKEKETNVISHTAQVQPARQVSTINLRGFSPLILAA